MSQNLDSAERRLAAACLISFSCFFAAYMRMPIVPLLAASLGADPVQAGLISASFMITAALLSIPAGLISDRLGRRPLLLGGLAVMALSSFLLSRSHGLGQMAVVYLLFGAGLATFSPALMSYVADVTPAERLGHAYGRYTMALYCGMTLGPAAGGYAAALSGLQEVFVLVGGLFLIMLLLACRYLPAPPIKPVTIHRKTSAGPTLLLILKNRPLLACLLATLGCCLGYGMFVTFMPLYMKDMGMHTVQVGYVFTAQALANALSRLPTGKLSDRISNKGVLIGSGLALFSLAMAALAVCRSVTALMLVAIIMGAGMGVAFTVICARIAELVPPQMRGLAVGCYNTCVYTGMMLSSVAMGPVIKLAGFAGAFVLNGMAGIVVVVLFMALYHTKRAGVTIGLTDHVS